jgi:protein gp37
MGLTNIQWCNYTFNPWIGCTMARDKDGKIVQECIYCYAKTLDDNRFSKTMGGASKEHPVSHWGNGAPRYRTSAGNWLAPLKWNRQATKDGTRPRVFCASLGDWLDDDVDAGWIADLLSLIRATPGLDWLLLTKRPQNWLSRIEAALFHVEGLPADGSCRDVEPETPTGIWLNEWTRTDGEGIPSNVWIGVSAGADQAAALDIPARVHFLSCEPMLRPLDTTHAARFDWIIFGGESGKGARECHLKWIRDGVAFCRQHTIAPFVKQLGALPMLDRPIPPLHQPCKLCLKDSHGGEMEEWPADMRVREFPKVKVQ